MKFGGKTGVRQRVAGVGMPGSFGQVLGAVETEKELKQKATGQQEEAGRYFVVAWTRLG